MVKDEYKFLARRDGSNYHQFFYKGRNLRAETLFRQTVGVNPQTPEEVALDYDVPIAAVLEAIDYCTSNEELLRQEREQDLTDLRERGLLQISPVAYDSAAKP